MRFDASARNALLEIMKWRRDERHFSTHPIANADLESLKEAFELAPSVGNSRPWRVISVQSAEARAAVQRSFESANQAAAAGYADEQRQQYLSLKLAGLKEAPEQWAIYTETDPLAGNRLGRQTMPETLHYSSVSAIHTIWLVARAMNIGVGWVSILDIQMLNAALQPPERWSFTAYLCLGYPKAPHNTPELHRVNWQENLQPQTWLSR